MNLLKITNDYSYLMSLDKELKRNFYKLFRKRPPDYYHNVAYQTKRWDGFINFFREADGRFLTGLLPEVYLALKRFKVDYETDDIRTQLKWKYTNIDKDFLQNFSNEKIELFDYQVDLINQAIKHNRGIIKAPTSAGKTFISIGILKSLPPKTPVLFITKSASLVDQNYKEMKKWGIPDLGRWYGKFKEPNYVMCCTAHKKTFESLKKLLPKFKVLIVDEVHEIMSPVPKRAFKKMKNCSVRLGISATPMKDDGKDKCQAFEVKGFFGPILKTSVTESGLLTTSYLQERKILSKSLCTIYPVDKPDLVYEPYLDAVTLGIAKNIHFHQMVKKLAKTLKGRTLIMVERIEQGEMLKGLLPKAHWIQGKDDLEKRTKMINDLKEGEQVVAIVMQKIISSGINVFLHNLINAAGGQAHHSVVQRMGRGLRTAKDKEVLNYYDFLFNINTYLHKHSEKRIKVLREEGHEVIVKDTIDF